MNRRHMLGAVGAGAAGLAVLNGSKAFAGQHDEAGVLDPKTLEDLKLMEEDIRVLNQTAEHCLTRIKQGQGDVSLHADMHEHVMDCAAVCQVSLAFMVRKSPFAQTMHAASAETCEKTAKVCADSKDDAEIVKRCVEISRKCAEMCRRHAKMKMGKMESHGG